MLSEKTISYNLTDWSAIDHPEHDTTAVTIIILALVTVSCSIIFVCKHLEEKAAEIAKKKKLEQNKPRYKV